MAKRRPGETPCPFGEKFSQYLAREGSNVNKFARKHGLKQRTLQGWVKEGVRVPDAGLKVIARATGIPAGYWINENLPWPPAPQYGTLLVDLYERLQEKPMSRLLELYEMVGDDADFEQTLALRRAARQRPKP